MILPTSDVWYRNTLLVLISTSSFDYACKLTIVSRLPHVTTKLHFCLTISDLFTFGDWLMDMTMQELTYHQ